MTTKLLGFIDRRNPHPVVDFIWTVIACPIIALGVVFVGWFIWVGKAVVK